MGNYLMAWSDETVAILRVLIDDVDTPQKYTDDRLSGLVVVAAFQVGNEIDFPITYVADSVNVLIVPDPSLGTNRDERYLDLVCLKAACILDRGVSSRVGQQAIRIKDGASEIDLRSVPQAQIELLKNGWCAVYQDRKQNYIVSQSGTVVGASIMSPFRIFAGYGGYRPFGTGFDPRWAR